MGTREQGTVKWYNAQKGHGFIMRDGGGGDIYLNRRALPRGRRWEPDEGDRVEYEVRESEKGLFAAQLDFLSTKVHGCGCVFCDLNLAPTIIEGRAFHSTTSGMVDCSRNPATGTAP